MNIRKYLQGLNEQFQNMDNKPLQKCEGSPKYSRPVCLFQLARVSFFTMCFTFSNVSTLTQNCFAIFKAFSQDLLTYLYHLPKRLSTGTSSRLEDPSWTINDSAMNDPSPHNNHSISQHNNKPCNACINFFFVKVLSQSIWMNVFLKNPCQFFWT